MFVKRIPCNVARKKLLDEIDFYGSSAAWQTFDFKEDTYEDEFKSHADSASFNHPWGGTIQKWSEI
ncbi:hypothetical protein FJO98_12375 [Enterococcus sp. PF-2]|jgi:hypothetical protein|nr:hypothetical protein CO692_12305 [Enterococcus sp. FDAARGOS_375]AUJ84732.1 hypothetical protein CXM95_04390 [Enterococcus sp. CR-Ec1]AVC42239.1 hypothetical protein AL523_18140 [Enterococcus gallinarum]EAC5558633.1 hypothetical protein [Listeria monocytogenes]EPH59290.1 hypothetical protein D931_03861 [Enterococcus faecium 13.SD.W.09]EPH92881.1 hypothetical protein D922_02316 [Enterococcus faecalis 06-MB-DW-09]MBO1097760.1 hypothetical protein [Enterococcus casseliflavus]TPE01455.1 hypoth